MDQQYQLILTFQPYFIWRWSLTLQYCLGYHQHLPVPSDHGCYLSLKRLLDQKFRVIEHVNKEQRRLRTAVLSSAAPHLDSS